MAAINAAEQAAEAIRRLNHETMWPGAVTPAEAYYVLGDLVSLVERLPQALSQLLRKVTEYPGVVGADDMGDPVEIVLADLAEGVGGATSHLIAARDRLSRAHQAASHLTLLDPEGE